MKSNRTQLGLGLCLLIAVLTVMAYWPLAKNKFVSVDDAQYLIENSHVNSGVTLSGLRWALTSGYASNWHPLTWVSHMLDCNLFGLNPVGHHLTSLAFHLANSILLFLLLQRLTSALWRSLFVALFFALHPTHVESVAWAAERKDVLSAFFFLLTIWAYAKYVAEKRPELGERRKMRSFYLLALILFALGLMSKPMLVTLPFVLLLLDYWPLRRFEFGRSMFAPLLIEKLPFFVLSILASVVTFRVQNSGGAVSSFSDLPLASRLANAAISYLSYVGKTVWPVGLSAIYVHPAPWPRAMVVTAALVLLVVTILACAGARRRPHVFTGWFWFLGTLVPALGIVQVGPQAMADRYLYTPSLGLYILVVWGVAELAAGRSQAQAFTAADRAGEDSGPPFAAPASRPGRIAVLLGISALAGCMLCTWFQVQYWRNGVTLYQRALILNPNNYVACDYLGNALHDAGRDEDALTLFTRSLQLQPRYPEGQYNLGSLLLRNGLFDEAVSHLEIAVSLAPNDANARHNLANAYLQQDRLPKAADEYLRAIALKPDDAGVRASLGSALLRQGKLPEAAARFSEALQLEPNHIEAHRNLAVVLVQLGKGSEAISHFAAAVRLNPSDPELRFNLGLALLDNQRPGEAREQFEKILQLRPDDTKSHYRLASALQQEARIPEAIRHYREALRLTPEFPEALNDLARILATNPAPELRNGAEAITLALKACALTKDENPSFLLTLAAADAESGQFSDAVALAGEAKAKASAAKQKQIVLDAERALTLFQAQKPLRDNQ